MKILLYGQPISLTFQNFRKFLSKRNLSARKYILQNIFSFILHVKIEKISRKKLFICEHSLILRINLHAQLHTTFTQAKNLHVNINFQRKQRYDTTISKIQLERKSICPASRPKTFY